MKKWIKIVIWILVILVIGVQSFFLVKSIMQNNDTIDENNSLEQKLADISNENNQITTDYLLDLLDSSNLNVFDRYQKNLDFKQDAEQLKLDYAYWYFKDNYDFSTGVDQSVFDKLFKKVFGDEKFKHQNLKCSCGKDLLVYDSQSKTYKYSSEHLGHGLHSLLGASYNKAVSLTISNKEYKLTVSKVFVDYNYDYAYSNASATENYRLFEFDVETDTIDDVIKKYEANYEEYKDKLTKYVYTFEKNNGKFNLLKYEIID